MWKTSTPNYSWEKKTVVQDVRAEMSETPSPVLHRRTDWFCRQMQVQQLSYMPYVLAIFLSLQDHGYYRHLSLATIINAICC